MNAKSPQSVTLNDAGPTWGPLLRGIEMYVDDNGQLACPQAADKLKTIEGSADEMIRLIIDGFSAIGELSWRAAMFDGGSIDPDIFAKLAPLQTQLMELVSILRCTEADAASFRGKLDAAQPAAGA